jgi:hypothetical protein
LKKLVLSENTVEKQETEYNLLMHFAIFAMRALEVIFFTGLAGSCIVVAISFIEDGKELFAPDTESEKDPHPGA